MVFSSLTFLFVFLPITAALYFIIPNRIWRNAVLLLASLVFYAWGEPRYILLLLLAAVEGWLGGFAIVRAKSPHTKKTALIVTTVLLLGNLAVFKYLGFACATLAPVVPALGRVKALALPIGISFYTFQILSYDIDLYRGKVALQRSFLQLLLYVSFFPQLIAGPIGTRPCRLSCADGARHWTTPARVCAASSGVFRKRCSLPTARRVSPRCCTRPIPP